MKWYKPNKTEWGYYFASMPFLATVCNYLLFEEKMLSREVLIQSNLVIYFVGLIAWYAHVSFSNYINIRFNHYAQVNQRTGWLFLLHVVVTLSSVSVYFLGYSHFGFLGYQLNIEKYVAALVLFFYIISIANTISGFRHTVRQIKAGLAEKEESEQENLITEFEGLKSQVPPHFLYSCLNSLSIMIEESPRDAELFIDELSKVCRYLMQPGGDGFTELARELEFIKSYFYLLKTRHGNAISFDIEVNEESRRLRVPVHTLQLLVENAVKHNRLDKKAPLKIEIRTSGTQRLMVINTLQRKAIQVPSGETGLSHIKNRYRSLNTGEVIVREEENSFMVLIPLIARAS